MKFKPSDIVEYIRGHDIKLEILGFDTNAPAYLAKVLAYDGCENFVGKKVRMGVEETEELYRLTDASQATVKEASCHCGAHSVGSQRHQDYCPLFIKTN